MAELQPPPIHIPIMGLTGKMDEVWQRYFLSATSTIANATAPGDARYLVTEADGALVNGVSLGALTAGYLHITTALGIATVKSSFATTVTLAPADPTGTVSLVGVMMGIAGTFTPTVTGRALVTLTGTIFNPTAIADGAKVQLRYGGGAAPANGDALTGGAVGSLERYIAATVLQKVPFSLTAILDGLTLNTAVWIDAALAAVTGGTATITDLFLTALEV